MERGRHQRGPLRPGTLLVEKGDQGEPAASDEEAAALGERGAGLHQPVDIGQVAAYPRTQFDCRHPGIGDRRLVGREFEPFQGVRADVGRVDPPGQVQRVHLVIVGRGGIGDAAGEGGQFAPGVERGVQARPDLR